ncbi:hypothetical protein M0R45_027207 [Rubus argutus]|uniref:Uncharacterized protein n=1 Tax=Rubus argutus TaxID=59490 RepID=A0AAW1WZM3_RUBAR
MPPSPLVVHPYTISSMLNRDVNQIEVTACSSVCESEQDQTTEATARCPEPNRLCHAPDHRTRRSAPPSLQLNHGHPKSHLPKLLCSAQRSRVPLPKLSNIVDSSIVSAAPPQSKLL